MLARHGRGVAAGAALVVAGALIGTALAIAPQAPRTARPAIAMIADAGAAAAPAARSTASGTTVSATYGESDLIAAVTRAYGLITSSYAGRVQTQSLINGALNGMLNAVGDPFSQYLPPAVSSAFSGSLSGYGGIGVALSPTSAGAIIDSVEAGGPAYEAGMRSGDMIQSVDGKSLAGMSLSDIAAALDGPAGTKVTMMVDLPLQSAPQKYVLTRVLILPPSVFAGMPLPGVGLIKITSFTARTAEEFDHLYAQLQAHAGKAGLRGLVLDLRGNGGGYVGAALHIAEELAPTGAQLLKIVDAQGHVSLYSARSHPPVPPIVITVDGGTASAAEILAGSLQYTHAAVLVGSRTYGKGSVQELYDMPGGGSVKLTIAHDELPNGHSWDLVGLQPNVSVSQPSPAWTRVPNFASVGQRALKPGMVGLDVLGLQQRLAFLGYAPGPRSGVYGNATAKAVSVFEKVAGLTETGTMDAADWAAMSKAMVAKVNLLKAQPVPDVVMSRALQVLKSKMASAG